MDTRRVLVQIPRSGQLFEVTGRAARMVLEIIAHAEQVNVLPKGRVVFSFIDTKLTAQLVEAWHPTRDHDEEVA